MQSAPQFLKLILVGVLSLGKKILLPSSLWPTNHVRLQSTEFLVPYVTYKVCSTCTGMQEGLQSPCTKVAMGTTPGPTAALWTSAILGPHHRGSLHVSSIFFCFFLFPCSQLPLAVPWFSLLCCSFFYTLIYWFFSPTFNHFSRLLRCYLFLY